MITAINCSMLDSTSTFDNDETNTGVSKSAHLEITSKQLLRETILCCRAEWNLVSRGQNIWETISTFEKFTLK